MNIIKILSLFVAALPLSATAAEVLMKTSSGDFVIEVYEDKAPKSAENFLQYVNDGFFDNLIFHRVIPNFMIQGGGFTQSFEKKATRAPIINEGDNLLKNLKYTLSMARTNDPNSATSQFFINVNDNDFLDYSEQNPGYAVFGKVVSGTEVIDAIAVVPTTAFGNHADTPKKPIIILEARVQ